MSEKMTKNLREFHDKIGAPSSDKPKAPVTDWRFFRIQGILRNAADSVIHEHQSLNTGTAPSGPELAILRVRLMIEELAETCDAMAAGDVVEFADGLADLEYVVRGTGVTYGIPLHDVHEIVHASNMSKTKMDKDSKGGKGEGFVAPQEGIGALLLPRM